ncbi:OTU domain-containing protein 4 [Ornithorhynchus anatinus]|nr:OTU domain-containing protein 4 [Ornithorhynchus anatinus]
MDAYLRSLGLYRQPVAKDGSCLFRAVAEQVLHSQSRHIEVRMACIDYLQKNREKFEAFVEGPFEEYLKRLKNPQEWVGEVEISALSLMYKRDFIIYQKPNVSPSHVTENSFPEKVFLCFSNGNHYDIVYPIKYKDSSALCQSLLYELLYEKVFHVDVSKIMRELYTSDEVVEESTDNCEISDSDDDSYRSKITAANDVNGFKSRSGNQHFRNNGNSTSLPVSRKVLKSLNPKVYRNIEYEIWLQSKQAQQKSDFSLATGLQYDVGDKFKPRLNQNGKFHDAHSQDTHSENGPVFEEEHGAKYSVSLKNLKPLPQTERWNTVYGKKIRKPSSTPGQNFQPDADCRGPKSSSKPIKSQSPLPPRLQQTVVTKQQALSCQSHGPPPQQASTEHKLLSRTPSQGIRKPERERTEDSDQATRDCNYFGLSPKERREKQAIEESRLLYEIQQRDEKAFPALSSPSVCQTAAQTTNTCSQRKLPGNERRGNRRRVDIEEQRDKDANLKQIHLDQKFEQSTSEFPKNDGDGSKCLRASTPSKLKKTQPLCPAEQKSAEPVSLANPSVLLVPPEVHLPPTVPSLPATVPPWQCDPAAYGPTGVPSQVPVLSVTQTLTPGLDSTVSQAHLTPTPVAPVPLPIQAINQPIMPLPQTLSLYQDPLFPGFPLNEKGERATAPAYSLCNTGDDLPKDKNVLRFFFNLGVKAFSYPMWAPHYYLYPLHQAYFTPCRVYAKVPVPVYPHNYWFQEAPSSQSEHDSACTERHFPEQNESSANDQGAQAEPTPPTSFTTPMAVPPSQGSECQEPVSHQVDIESVNLGQPLHANYEESLEGKGAFPQPPFGPGPFLGAVPMPPPYFPPFWYGYPFQGFVENTVVRHDVVISPEDKGALALPLEDPATPKECDLVSTDQEANREGALPLSTAPREGSVQSEQSTREKKAEQTPAVCPPASEVKAHLHLPVPHVERKTLPLVPDARLKSTTSVAKERPEESRESKATGTTASSVDSRVQKPREESSEDENEVSDILKSGRSKQFYNQTYGNRKYRHDWAYSGRGGYPHPRGEEPWKGPPNRSREEGFQYHRNFRGRPFRGDRRKSAMGDSHRGHHQHP